MRARLAEPGSTEIRRRHSSVRGLLRHTQKVESLFLWKIALLHNQQRLDEAEETVEETIKLFPQSVPLSIERGWLKFHQNRFE